MKFRLVLIFLVFSIFCNAQFTEVQKKKLDSLNKISKKSENDTLKALAFVELSEMLAYSNISAIIPLSEKAIKVCNSLLNAANTQEESISIKKIKARAINNIGFSYDNQGDIINALKKYEEALKIQQEIGDKKGEARAFVNIGFISQKIGEGKKALEYFHKALKIQIEINDKEAMATSFNNIGIQYANIMELDIALEYYKKSLSIRKQLNDDVQIAMTLNNIGHIYMGKHEYYKALEYQLKALRIQENKQDNLSLPITLINIGSVYESLQKKDSSLYFYNRALEIAENHFNKRYESVALKKIGKLYYELRNIKESKRYATKSLKIAEELGYPENIYEASKLLYDILDYEKDYEKAIKMLQLSYSMNDSLKQKRNQKELITKNLNYKYEQEKLAAKKEQEKKDALLKIEQERQTFIIISVSIILILTIVFSVIVFSRLKITRKQNKLIAFQKQKVETQKQDIEEKNREISASIHYAKRIQDAILPDKEEINKHLKNSFIFFKPKDIVSGDFYWVEYQNELTYFAVADCTGHGVPGAMISVICYNALRSALKEFNIIEPAKILDKTREIVIEQFRKSKIDVKDGMDVALCSINLKNNELKYSGANNSLYIVKNKNLIEVKANKQPIGSHSYLKQFDEHVIRLEKNDTIYLFSDGFPDQFGGDKGKKYKYKNFKNLLISISEQPLENQKEMLEKELKRWKNGYDQVDDICILGYKV
jgi:serine phosphatase RsbU (regulator of sigma subunit)/Tfp pilus assembly protein PilF